MRVEQDRSDRRMGFRNERDDVREPQSGASHLGAATPDGPQNGARPGSWHVRAEAVTRASCLAIVLVLLFHARLEARLQDPATRLASTTSSGAASNGPSSYPALAADGRFVAFASSASNLAAGDANGYDDVFVKDLATSAIVCVSLTPAGATGNGESSAASICGDGSRVVLASEASDLVPSDTNGVADVFLRDLAGGTTLRLSVAAGGAEADGASAAPRISADGRFVAFTSRATNLVAADLNAQSDVFVRDLATGALERISISAAGGDPDGPSEGAAISADGRFVAFASAASNLIGGEAPPTRRTWNVYRRDRETGATVRASPNQVGLAGDGQSSAPAISADGRWIAFTSRASDLVAGDGNARADVYLRDCAAGSTTRVSLGPGGVEPAGDSVRPSISGDGRRVVFESSAANILLQPSPARSTWVLVFDRESGERQRVVPAAAVPRPDGGTLNAAISADGRWIAFSSGEPGLVAGDANELEDVFVHAVP